MQNFRPVTLTVFEIQGLKLNKKKKKKQKKHEEELEKWTFAISPMLVVQF